MSLTQSPWSCRSSEAAEIKSSVFAVLSGKVCVSVLIYNGERIRERQRARERERERERESGYNCVPP